VNTTLVALPRVEASAETQRPIDTNAAASTTVKSSRRGEHDGEEQQHGDRQRRDALDGRHGAGGTVTDDQRCDNGGGHSEPLSGENLLASHRLSQQVVESSGLPRTGSMSRSPPTTKMPALSQNQ
jgi:hypothetical protein